MEKKNKNGFDWMKDRVQSKNAGVIILKERIHESLLTKPREEITDDDSKNSITAFIRKYIDPDEKYPFQEEMIKNIIASESKEIVLPSGRNAFK